MTRLDSARDTATQLAVGAKERLSPALDALGPKASQAAHSARVQYDRHIAPQLGHAFASLPPDAQENVLRAVHRAQEAALAAKHSAARAAAGARSTVGPRVAYVVEEARTSIGPVALEAQTRGAAALTALHGNVTAAEIGELAARNARKKEHNAWTTGLAVAGAAAVLSGVVVWQWWRHQSNPEWLVEPTTDTELVGEPDASGSPAAGGAPLNGSPGTPSASPSSGSSGSSPSASPSPGSADGPTGTDAGHPEASSSTPKPGPPPGGKTAPDAGPDDDRPKPHDPRKPH